MSMPPELAQKLEARLPCEDCRDRRKYNIHSIPAKGPEFQLQWLNGTAYDLIGLIRDLQEMIDASAEPSSPFHISHASTSTDATVYPNPSTEQPQETKKRKTTDGTSRTDRSVTESARYSEAVHANQHIDKVHAILKKECEDVARLCDDVSIWIQLAMPKIEDGDNFGVAIQEEVLAEVTRCQQSAYNLRDTARQHHQNRAKICSKLIKYPNVEDYTLALKEHDEKILHSARCNLFDLRNIYAVVTNLFQKNIAKIRAPKGNNSVALY